MLTPYELGQEVAHIQIRHQKTPKIEENVAERVACMLGIEGDHEIEFLEGYRNSFAEAKAEQDEDIPPWIPSAAELDEIEEGLEYPPYHCDCPGDCNHSSF